MPIGDIPADGNTRTDQGDWVKQLSLGTTLYTHDPIDFNGLPAFFGRPIGLQLGKDALLCSCCGDARPKSYFDVVEWNELGLITAVDNSGKPTKWDGVRFPVKWHHTCRQCVNMRDPKLAKEKYCSVCKVMHPRASFADDDTRADGKYPMCRDGKKRYDAARYAEKKWLNQGQAPGQWGGRRERAWA